MKYSSFFGRTVLLIIEVFLFAGSITSQAHAATLPASVLAAANLYEKQGSYVPLPGRLLIPSIKVDVPIESLGLTSAGAVAAPAGPNDVAWFNQGPAPGRKGSAVIVGHFGWKDGVEAAFDKLHQLHKGDLIYVKDAKGVQSTFVVTDMRTYSSQAETPNVFASNDGNHLNLITCSGKWNTSKKSYTERLVVFTDLTS